MKNLFILFFTLFSTLCFSQYEIECVPFTSDDEFAGLKVVDPATGNEEEFEFPYYTYYSGGEFTIVSGDMATQLVFPFTDVGTFNGEDVKSGIVLRNDIEECMSDWVCIIVEGKPGINDPSGGDETGDISTLTQTSDTTWIHTAGGISTTITTRDNNTNDDVISAVTYTDSSAILDYTITIDGVDYPIEIELEKDSLLNCPAVTGVHEGDLFEYVYADSSECENTVYGDISNDDDSCENGTDPVYFLLNNTSDGFLSLNTNGTFSYDPFSCAIDSTFDYFNTMMGCYNEFGQLDTIGHVQDTILRYAEVEECVEEDFELASSVGNPATQVGIVTSVGSGLSSLDQVQIGDGAFTEITASYTDGSTVTSTVSAGCFVESDWVGFLITSISGVASVGIDTDCNDDFDATVGVDIDSPYDCHRFKFDDFDSPNNVNFRETASNFSFCFTPAEIYFDPADGNSLADLDITLDASGCVQQIQANTNNVIFWVELGSITNFTFDFTKGNSFALRYGEISTSCDCE